MSEPAYIDDNDENALESDRIKTSDFDDFKDGKLADANLGGILC